MSQFVHCPGDCTIRVVSALREGGILMSNFRHLSASVVLIRGGISSWIDDVMQPIRMGSTLVVVITSRIISGRGIAERAGWCVTRFQAATVVFEQLRAATRHEVS